MLEIQVEGKSMTPLLQQGDIVLINNNKISPTLGDICCYRDTQAKQLVIHRVISTTPFQTKGDYSLITDEVSTQQLLGILSHIKRDDKTYQFKFNKTFARLSFFYHSRYPYLLRSFMRLGILSLALIAKKDHT